jgi:uncharacterized protein YjbJ (UPF0337 family)
LKGKANETVGKARANTGAQTGSKKTEAKGVGKMVKGEAQKTAGKARSATTKATR